MGPAVAAIALLCAIATAQRDESAPQSSIGGVSLPSATYTGAVHQRVAANRSDHLKSRPTWPDKSFHCWQRCRRRAVLRDSAGATLVRQGNSVSVRLPKKGEATLKVKFLVSWGDVTKRRLAFVIPPALSSRLALTVDESEPRSSFPTAVSFYSIAAGQQTRIEAVVGAGERRRIAVTPRVKRAAEIAHDLLPERDSGDFHGGVMGVRSLLDYQVTQGELREARVRFPAGHRLLRVAGRVHSTCR